MQSGVDGRGEKKKEKKERKNLKNMARELQHRVTRDRIWCLADNCRSQFQDRLPSVMPNFGVLYPTNLCHSTNCTRQKLLQLWYWNGGVHILNFMHKHATKTYFATGIRSVYKENKLSSINLPPPPHLHTDVLHSVSRIQQYTKKRSNLCLYKVPVGIRTPRIVQPVASSLYRLPYPGSPVSLHSVAQSHH